MSFTREKVKDFYLLTTDVENIFINEYLPEAPGDFVKVYLYGLLYSQNGGEMTRQQMSLMLGIDESQIDNAWNYWAKMGVVEKSENFPMAKEPYDIKFKQLRSLMYGQGSSGNENSSTENYDTKNYHIKNYDTKNLDIKEEENSPLCNNELRELLFEVETLMGKTLSPRDAQEVYSWKEEIGATKEVIISAMEYCMEKGKTGINYISKVISQWTKDGLKTQEDVEERLDSLEERMGVQKKILRSLGLNRSATEAEKEMIDGWFDKMHFNMDRVMEACIKASFISSPNLRYVNKILENWCEEASKDGRDVNNKIKVTQADLNKYYEFLRKKAESEAETRKEEVYSKIPRLKELDKESFALGKQLSMKLLGGNRKEVEEIRKMMSLLKQERAVLLTENNYHDDYTDIKYACSECRDTGITEDGIRCNCVKERMGEVELWQNSNSSIKSKKSSEVKSWT
jgi:DnaD/phage-associated family protein